MEYTYDVIMRTQIGNRKGQLRVNKKQEKINGFLKILGHENPVVGTVAQDGVYALKGELITLVRTIPFVAQGYADEKTVCLTLHCPDNTFYITGTAIKGE